MQSIKQWLFGSKNYEAGVALYLTYGESDAIKAMLQQGQSEYRQQRLEKLLKEISDNSSCAVIELLATEPDSPAPSITIDKPVSKYDAHEDKVKPEEDPYRNDWVPLYEQMKFLQHNLRGAEDDEARGAMAHKILELERQCMWWWARRAYYLKYKKHAPIEDNAPELAITDVNALRKALCNYRTYHTKAKKKLELDPLDHKAIARLDKYAQLIEEIEKQLENG